MNKITILTLLIALLSAAFNTTPSVAYAAEEVSAVVIDNGYYYETIISEEITSSFALEPTIPTVIKTKSTSMKNSDGETLWTLSITATFVYDGKIAECVSCTPKAVSYDSSWIVQSVTSTKNDNSATATMIIRRTDLLDSTHQDYTKSVTITCDPFGKVS